ncbi:MULTISPECIES: hypothetical protein [Pantoea]|nr:MULTISPECIES: hypothetical protein [Pantoea]
MALTLICIGSGTLVALLDHCAGELMMRKMPLAAWFFLLLSFGSCAQPLPGPPHMHAYSGRHLDAGNSGIADVAETPDEHIQERRDEVGYHQ